MTRFVDTHCHLDQYQDPEQVALRAARANVAVIAVTGLPSHYSIGSGVVRALSGVRLALGLHPLLAPHSTDELRAFRQLASSTSYIGEVGLDFSRHGRDTRTSQLESFGVVLDTLGDLARQGRSRFVTLHSRGAESVVLEKISRAGVGPVVFHWYSGPFSTIREAAAQGHYFSVNPAMFRSASGRRIVQRLPADRVLLETDGPYVQVDGRPAEPGDIAGGVSMLAELLGESSDDAARRVQQNFRRLLRALHLTSALNP